jgi:aspartate-semialdehyde dehydrogenase
MGSVYDDVAFGPRNMGLSEEEVGKRVAEALETVGIPHLKDKAPFRLSVDPSIKLTATCVRVPVFVGHSEAVNIEFENEISAADAQRLLREAPGVMLVDKREDGGYVTPVECVGDYATFVSRVREDPTVENGLSLWVVSDNLRKGAALNAVQIAELLGRKHLKKAA